MTLATQLQRLADAGYSFHVDFAPGKGYAPNGGEWAGSIHEAGSNEGFIAHCMPSLEDVVTSLYRWAFEPGYRQGPPRRPGSPPQIGKDPR